MRSARITVDVGGNTQETPAGCPKVFDAAKQRPLRDA